MRQRAYDHRGLPVVLHPVPVLSHPDVFSGDQPWPVSGCYVFALTLYL